MAISTYASVKEAVIGVVDDFTVLDIAANYAPNGKGTYNAKTKLIKIGINAPVLAIMPVRLNKVLGQLFGKAWNPVGAVDLISLATIGDLIALACGQSHTAVPPGEPT